MYANTEDIMGIFSGALAEMDRNTVDYMIDEMQKKVDQLLWIALSLNTSRYYRITWYIILDSIRLHMISIYLYNNELPDVF